MDWVQRPRKLGHVRRAAPGPGGHHDVVARDRLGTEVRGETASRLCLEPVDPGLQPNRQIHLEGIGFQVVRDVVLAGERPRVARKRQVWKPVVLRRREQPQRVPLAAPVVADPLVAVEDEELPPQSLEVVAGGEAGLACPNNQGLDVLDGHGTPPSVHPRR